MLEYNGTLNKYVPKPKDVGGGQIPYQTGVSTGKWRWKISAHYKNKVQLRVHRNFELYFSSLPQELQDTIYITSGSEPNSGHAKNSLHYSGRAIDITMHGGAWALFKYMVDN